MPPRDLAARVRAAFAYKGLTKLERAQALGVSVRQVTRIEAGKAPVDTDRLEQIAKSTGVPLSFLRDGFEPDEPSVAERVEALESGQQAMRDDLRRLRLAVLELAPGSLQPGRSQRAQRGTDRRRQVPGGDAQ